MKTILIVYHSLTGGTRQMADAAARGGEAQTDVQVHLLQAREAGPDDVLNADGYIFATPENLAVRHLRSSIISLRLLRVGSGT